MLLIREKIFTLLVVLFAALAPGYAGRYANGTNDPNAIDSGIVGFINEQVNPVFIGWASTVVDYSPSDETTFYGIDGVGISIYTGNGFADPNTALGEVTGDQMDVVALGDINWEPGVTYDINDVPGNITLGFDNPITNGPGPDFSVFENGFGSSGTFIAELAFVEVSTNGQDFARFPTEYTASAVAVGPYGSIDVTRVYNFAGKHVNNGGRGASYGTPFNLSDLAAHQLVLGGVVDLNNINYIRIVDVPGKGYFSDSFGKPIYDAWHTWGSGGFDLEAVGVLATIYGDCDSNGRVDWNDFIRVSAYWKNNGGWPQGDFDEDGDIDGNDLILMAGNWLYSVE